ncbi:MAG: hypothetical protein ACHQ0J_01760 [Candidatus Dormibacterales bacterium]
MPDNKRLSTMLPSWWFPSSLVGMFPDGRPLAGAGLALGIALYVVADILNSLSSLGLVSFKEFLLILTSHRLLGAAPFLVLAVLLTGSRSQPPTTRQQSADDGTLVAVVVIAAVLEVFAVIGFLAQLADWTGGFLPTVYEFLIRIAAIVSTGTTAVWALGRLNASRVESQPPTPAADAAGA